MPEEAEEQEPAEFDVVTIEDEDGFTTTWPWPTGSTMLHSTGFVEVFEALHDEQRREQGP